MRGEGTDVVAQQGLLGDVLSRMRRELSDLDIDAGRRDALTARIDALGEAVAASHALADAAFAMLDRIAVGVALVDMAGAVVWSNRYLRDISAQNDGLTIAAGRLRVGDPARAAALAAIIERTRARRGDGGDRVAAVLAVGRGRDTRPYLVTALPLAHGSPVSGGDQGIIAVLAADPSRRVTLPSRDLEDLFGLTPAESQVAALLAGGDRLDVAAEKLRVTTGTARTHLKHIFDKTGTGRQSELARLLHSLHGKIG